MNQQEFEKIFDNLTVRRKEVLQRVLAGETDVAIAEAMGVGKPTVRKYIERISQEFGLEKEDFDGRHYKRSDLVALFGKFKPELLREQDRTDILLILSLEKISAQDYLNIVKEYLDDKLQLSSDEEKSLIAKSLNKIGYEHYINGYFQYAVFCLEWAIKFDPNIGSVYYNLGSAYEKLGNSPSACDNYEKSLKYGGSAADAAVSNLARLKILQGNSAEAVQMIEPVLPRVLDKTHLTQEKTDIQRIVIASLCKNLGWAYFEQKHYKQAENYLRMSLEFQNDRAVTHCLLAKVQEAQGDKHNALISWQNCLKDDSTNQQVKNLDSKLPELDVWKLDARRALANKNV
jgi:tetratricopeptide (TPR) repeat protein